MRLLIEDDGTIEIIEVKIVRISGRKSTTSALARESHRNNIKGKKLIQVVGVCTQAVVGVIQLASLAAGLPLIA